MGFNRFVKAVFRQMGLEVHKYSALASPTAQIVCSLKKYGIDLVLDVGANQGQFASGLRDAGYPGRIISFEPLSEAYGILQELSKKRCAM